MMRMLGVVRVTADHPVVGLHGFLATGKILLCEEGLLGGRDLGEVFLALIHHLRYCREAHACKQLVLSRRGCAFGLLAEVQAVAVRISAARTRIPQGQS